LPVCWSGLHSRVLCQVKSCHGCFRRHHGSSAVPVASVVSTFAVCVECQALFHFTMYWTGLLPLLWSIYCSFVHAATPLELSLYGHSPNVTRADHEAFAQDLYVLRTKYRNIHSQGGFHKRQSSADVPILTRVRRPSCIVTIL
jgi:hypothetical protein